MSVILGNFNFVSVQNINLGFPPPMTLIVTLSMELLLLGEKYLFFGYVNIYVNHIKHFQLPC